MFDKYLINIKINIIIFNVINFSLFSCKIQPQKQVSRTCLLGGKCVQLVNRSINKWRPRVTLLISDLCLSFGDVDYQNSFVPYYKILNAPHYWKAFFFMFLLIFCRLYLKTPNRPAGLAPPTGHAPFSQKFKK